MMEQGRFREARIKPPPAPACAWVNSLQRLAYPEAVAAKSVRWAPSISVTSAPEIGLTPYTAAQR
ncbi:hypothetical protein GCM10025857_08540 [Alicyclobacillus contaminans]|nr:hypothetical protein GCM10025857_08540 [Alicyclobacillus contaminans]